MNDFVYVVVERRDKWRVKKEEMNGGFIVNDFYGGFYVVKREEMNGGFKVYMEVYM